MWSSPYSSHVRHRSSDGRRWRLRRSGRAGLSAGPLDYSLTRALTSKPGPEHEDSNGQDS
jgi:hypothetical protein